jgi:hypothetical protein
LEISTSCKYLLFVDRRSWNSLFDGHISERRGIFGALGAIGRVASTAVKSGAKEAGAVAKDAAKGAVKSNAKMSKATEKGVDKNAMQNNNNNNKPAPKKTAFVSGIMGVTRREFEFEELEDLL